MSADLVTQKLSGLDWSEPQEVDTVRGRRLLRTIISGRRCVYCRSVLGYYNDHGVYRCVFCGQAVHETNPLSNQVQAGGAK